MSRSCIAVLSKNITLSKITLTFDDSPALGCSPLLSPPYTYKLVSMPSRLFTSSVPLKSCQLPGSQRFGWSSGSVIRAGALGAACAPTCVPGGHRGLAARLSSRRSSVLQLVRSMALGPSISISSLTNTLKL